MEFQLSYTAEQEAFRKEVRDWLDENVDLSINIPTNSPEEEHENWLARRALGRVFGAKGWLYPTAPKEYGGGGLSLDEAIVLEEETNRIGINVPPYYDSGGSMSSACIRVWGTEEQKQLLLPAIYKGEKNTWQLLTEPGAGSDLAGVQTLAVKDGDEWVINGQKVFNGNNQPADRMWCIARTSADAPRHRNLGWFMIDGDTPGISTTPLHLLGTLGEGPGGTGHKNAVFLDNVRVPAIRLVGGENNGWSVASTHLEVEHGAGGTIRPNPIWNPLLAQCRELHGDADGYIDDRDMVDELVNLYGDLEVLRLLGARNYWNSHAKQPTTYEGSQMFYIRKMTGLRTTRRILEILGPAALTSDELLGGLNGRAERQQREGIVAVIPGGTADIQRLIMARRLGVGREVAEKAADTE